MELPAVVTEKVGPLPVWGWALAGGGVILVLSRLSAAPATSTGPTVIPGGGGTPIVNGVPVDEAAKRVEDAIAATQASDQTLFGKMLSDAQAASAAALAGVQQQDQAALQAQQLTLGQQIQAAIQAGKDALSQQQAADASAIAQLRAALDAAIKAATPPPAAAPVAPPPPTPTPAPPTTVPAPTGWSPPAWLLRFLPWSGKGIVAGYNPDHTLPATLHLIHLDGSGFHLPGGGLMQSWTLDPVNIRGKTVYLPLAFTTAGQANAQNTIELIVGRLNAIADGGYGWGVTSGSASDPVNIYIVIRSVIEDQIHAGKDPNSLGLPYWQAFLAGSAPNE